MKLGKITKSSIGEGNMSKEIDEISRRVFEEVWSELLKLQKQKKPKIKMADYCFPMRGNDIA